jgi:endonuclease-3 related protein
MENKLVKRRLLTVYEKLYNYFGPQNWWPGDTPFEIMVGAILTQNTNWQNVEKAIENLKAGNALCPSKILELPDDELAEMLRPSGYFNIKAKRLKNFVKWFSDNFNADEKKLSKVSLNEIRHKILKVNGVGKETADSILLYAANQNTFVVDAYTMRIFSRLGIISKDNSYEEVRKLFMDNIPSDIQLYNEYHALIVALGKDFCKPSPKCEKCPLKKIKHKNKN